MASSTPRIGVTDALRGLASLSVCWFHLTHGNTAFLNEGLVKSSGTLGWLGVEVFFVISGFVIPYALWSASYSVKRYPAFLLKRIVRLDPPYFASIVLVIAAAYLSEILPGFRGTPVSYSVVQVLLHVGYLNTLAGYDWLNPVYWTLAIEFQYYLLIGLVYPIVRSSSRRQLFSGLTVAMFAALIARPEPFIFHWTALFLLGILSFRYRVRLVGTRGYWLSLIGLVICGVATVGILVTCAGAIACVVIAFGEINSKVLSFFGKISYSLYLTHVVIGGRIVNFASRYETSDGVRLLVLIVGFLGCILGAYLFYLAIEMPSRRWAARVRYNSTSVKSERCEEGLLVKC